MKYENTLKNNNKAYQTITKIMKYESYATRNMI